MKSALRVLALLTLLQTSVSATEGADRVRCQLLFERHSAADLVLDEFAFDQVDGQGWRRYADAGCEPQVAALIEAYLTINRTASATVHWHLAQSLAMSGNTGRAITASARALRLDPNGADLDAHWNSYVRATVSFWNRDRIALKHHLHVLTTTDRGQVTSDPLRRAAELLLRCFGTDYWSLEKCAR